MVSMVSDSTVWAVFCTLLLAAILLPFGVRCGNRARHRRWLLRWAERYRLEIVQARRPWVRCSAMGARFFCTPYQTLFRIVVRDEQGNEYCGYARIGGFFGGGRFCKLTWDDGDGGLRLPDLEELA